MSPRFTPLQSLVMPAFAATLLFQVGCPGPGPVYLGPPPLPAEVAPIPEDECYAFGVEAAHPTARCEVPEVCEARTDSPHWVQVRGRGVGTSAVHVEYRSPETGADEAHTIQVAFVAKPQGMPLRPRLVSGGCRTYTWEDARRAGKR